MSHRRYTPYGISGGPGIHVPEDQFGYTGAAAGQIPPPATPAVPAATVYVSNKDDSGAGSFRQAFADTIAAGGGVIQSLVGQVDTTEHIIVTGLEDCIIDGGSGTTFHGALVLLNCKRVEFRNFRFYQAWQFMADPVTMSGCEDVRFVRCTLAFGTDQNGDIVGNSFGAGRNKRIQFYRCMNVWPLGPGYGLIAYFTDALWLTECLIAFGNTRPRLARSLTAVMDGCLIYNYNTSNFTPVHINGTTAGGQTPIPVAVDMVNNKVRSAGTLLPIISATNGPTDGTVYETGTEYELLDGTPKVTPDPDANADHRGASVSGMMSAGENANVIEANVGCTVKDALETLAWANIAGSVDDRIYFATGKSYTTLKYDWRDRTIISTWDPGVIDCRRNSSSSNLSFQFYLLNIGGGAYTHTVDLRLYDRSRNLLWQRLGTLEGDDLTSGGSGVSPSSGTMQQGSTVSWVGKTFPGPIGNLLELELTIDDGGGNDYVYKARTDFSGISV